MQLLKLQSPVKIDEIQFMMSEHQVLNNFNNHNIESCDNNNKQQQQQQRLPLAALDINNNELVVANNPYYLPMNENKQQQQHRLGNNTNDDQILLTRLLGSNELERGASLWPANSAHIQQSSSSRIYHDSTTSRLTANVGRGGQSFDIMNYFLLTPNGTPSAHDAIYGLQVSVFVE